MYTQESYYDQFDNQKEMEEIYFKARHDIKENWAVFSHAVLEIENYNKEVQKFGGVVVYHSVKLPHSKNTTQIAYLPEKNLSASGIHMEDAKEKLRKLIQSDKKE